MIRREVLRQIRAVAVLMVGILLVVGGIGTYVDQSCVAEANLWMPRYPGASVIQEDYSFMRPFGMGITNLILHTPDERDFVSQWYIENRRNARDQQRSNLADLSWRTTEDPQRGGTLIYMQSSCAQ